MARFMLYFGTAAIVLGLGKVHAVRHDYDFTGSSRFAWSIGFALGMNVLAYASGLPDLPRRGRNAVTPAIIVTGSATLLASSIQLFVGDALLPRFVVLGSGLAAIPWYVICAVVAAGGRHRAEGRDRVLVVADASEVEKLQAELERAPEQPAQIVASGFLGDLGADGGLIAAARATDANVVVLSRRAQLDDHLVDQAAVLHESGIRVRPLAMFYEQWLGKLPVSELERLSLMFDIGEIHQQRYGRVKRVTDLVLGVAGLAVLFAVLPFVVLGNLIANRGRLLFMQARVGRGGEEFQIIKFRTMRSDGGQARYEWTSEHDERITSFGRVMRKTHIDELPQVINVLAGDLSIVGPRPEQPHYVEELALKIPFYRLRHLVRPGITGWAQVKYHYAGSEHDALEKLQYEFYYLRHQSLRVDLQIVGRTFRDVLRMGGR